MKKKKAKIVKFDFLVKIELLLEMALDFYAQKKKMSKKLQKITHYKIFYLFPKYWKFYSSTHCVGNQKSIPTHYFNTKYFSFISHLLSFFLLLIVLEFCEKYEGRYKLIFVKRRYLIDIRKDNGNYCGLNLNKKIKNSAIV